MNGDKDWFELYLEKHPDAPSVVLIRSVELKNFPREFLHEPLLDLCCGDGFFARCLDLEGIQGCDIDQRAVRQAAAQKRTYVKVLNCDARTLTNFPEGVFSTVISNCALEHIDGIDQALMNIARVLKPNGRLIMSVPDESLNRWFFPGAVFTKLGLPRYARRVCEEYNRKQQHINILPFEEWKRKLEGSRLTVEREFHLFSEREYLVVTFFESFITDSFPGPFFRAVYSLLRKVVPVRWRKSLWRTMLKPIYRRSGPRSSGGELFIVARKD